MLMRRSRSLGGFALMALPVVLGLGAAAAITGILVGALLIGLAFAGAGQDHATGSRGTIPLGAHALYDRGIALGLILAALVLGIAGDRGAVLFFLGAGLARSRSRRAPAIRPPQAR